MLKKLIVAILACITLFLSQRALTSSRTHSVPQARNGTTDGPDKDSTTAVEATRAAFF